MPSRKKSTLAMDAAPGEAEAEIVIGVPGAKEAVLNGEMRLTVGVGGGIGRASGGR